MKILMMVLMVGLIGCGSGGSDPVIVPDESHCSDLTIYRKVSDISTTTYQISTNACNSITNVVFSTEGIMTSVTKDVQIKYAASDFQTIKYSGESLAFRVWTNISVNGSSVVFDYHYINGDSFITKTTLPNHVVTYIYEGEPEFNIILQDVLYEIVLSEVGEAIGEL